MEWWTVYLCLIMLERLLLRRINLIMPMDMIFGGVGFYAWNRRQRPGGKDTWGTGHLTGPIVIFHDNLGYSDCRGAVLFPLSVECRYTSGFNLLGADEGMLPDCVLYMAVL